MNDRDVVCFSHLRWHFVFQRPNHLMTRFARQGRVFFVEEPVFDVETAYLEREPISQNLERVIPRLPPGRSADEIATTMRTLLASLYDELALQAPIHWFYTPLMLPWAEGLRSSVTVYDCMDELKNFLHAPPELIEREEQLMAQADVVFTGGMALYESKRHKHQNVHGVPSSVDVAFFQRAREPQPEPADQASIAHPRVGYCGVIDERIDLPLLAEMARLRPQTQFVMIGPVVKISPDSLPRAANIHYLGGKSYNELPTYLASWDAAMMPFALNDATRFISPTKTPEYLAAGRRVVSTPITDVVEPYGRLGLVRIAHTAEEFASQLDAALADDGARDAARDQFLASTSWDDTWKRMLDLITEQQTARANKPRSSSAPETRAGAAAE